MVRIDDVRALEEGMWRAETRFDREWMDSRLHPDFVEFGRSGRVYRARDLLAALDGPTPETIDCELPLPNLAVTALAPTVALVTYDSQVRDGGATLHGRRTSVWVHDGRRWLLRLHQGTPFHP